MPLSLTRNSYCPQPVSYTHLDVYKRQVLTSGKAYSNVFHANGGSAAFSVMANTLRGVYGTDVLLATANSFTGSVLQADYNQKMAASMIMPNGLMSRQRTMTGAELKETVRAFVEGLSLIHI